MMLARWPIPNSFISVLVTGNQPREVLRVEKPFRAADTTGRRAQ